MRPSRWPLLHFFLLGGLLYAAQSAWPTVDVIQVEDVAQVDEEIFVREALRRGLDVTDPVARDRLVRNIQFAFSEQALTADAALKLAQRLGMAQRDAVVRRRLVQVMEARVAASVQVTDAQLREYLERHAARYQEPPRYRWNHRVYMGDDASARAQAALQRLQDGAPEEEGDAFLAGTAFASATADDMRRVLGVADVSALLREPPGRWQGPLRSPYGWHVVQIEAVIEPPPLDWARLRPQLAYALLPELERAAVRAELERLRGRYRIEVRA